MRLRQGQWLRWEVNARVGAACGCGSEWLYYLDVVNVVFGPHPEGAAVFLGRPDRHVQELIPLR